MYLRKTEEYTHFTHSEFDLTSNGKSQTKETTEYCFEKNNYKFCILDTPELCDTEGLDKDEET